MGGATPKKVPLGLTHSHMFFAEKTEDSLHTTLVMLKIQPSGQSEWSVSIALDAYKSQS